jgi:hypothetical protein
LVLRSTFNRSLENRLDALHLEASARRQIEIQRTKLAGIETEDARERRAIQESFVDGYRFVVWIAAALAVGSALSAAVMIRKTTEPESR